MQTSIYLAKLMGPVIGVAGVGFLLNRRAFLEMAKDFLDSTALIMLSGFLALVMGLAIINAHNIWVADWPVIITVFGWLSMVGGIVRITMPDVVRAIAQRMLAMTQFIAVEGVLLVALGGWLSFVGYLA